MDDVKLIPCPRCGGVPVVLIQPGWPSPRLHVECSACGKPGLVVYYSPEGKKCFAGVSAYEKRLLPDLAAARRHAAADWNERVCGDV